jgi:hypothetical protein
MQTLNATMISTMTKFYQVLAGLTVLSLWSTSTLADEIRRDVPFNQPIPATGRLTQRLPLTQLPAAKRFTNCPNSTKLVEYAESSHFQVMICADKKDANKFKYWMQKSKKTNKLTQIAARPDPNSQSVLWESGDYRAMIYADGARPNTINAYLESYNLKTKKGLGEALLYHYSTFYGNR